MGNGQHLPPGCDPLHDGPNLFGYFTANITHLGEEETGTGKLDLNFVNEGRLYDGSKWEDLKDNQPFFAQVNTLEAEYDIYDRKSAEKDRVVWVGEDDRGLELEVVALDLPDYLLVIHVMPTQLRRRRR